MSKLQLNYKTVNLNIHLKTSWTEVITKDMQKKHVKTGSRKDGVTKTDGPVFMCGIVESEGIF